MIQTRIIRRLAALCLLPPLLAGCADPADGPLDRIESAAGSWVVVNYWAEWCKPCIKEVPELNTLDARDDVTVLGVNFDGEQGDVLAAQVEKLGIAFPTLQQDPSAPLGLERPAVLPTTLVISPQGQLIETLVGPQTLESLLRATVDRGAG